MARSHHQGDDQLCYQGFDEPTGAELLRRSAEQKQQRPEGQEVEDRTNQVVDAIAHIANHVPGLLQREDNALLLVGIHFREEGGAFGRVPERLVMQVVQLASGQHALQWQVHRLRDVAGYFLVVAGDDLKLHPAVRQIDNDLLHIDLRWIEEEQKAGEGECVFIGVRIGIRPPVYRLRRQAEYAEAVFAPFAVPLLMPQI